MKTNEILRNIIDSRSMKQSEFASLLGIKTGRVNDILTGRTQKFSPTMKTLLAEKLHVCTEYMKSGDGPMYEPGYNVLRTVQAKVTYLPEYIINTLMRVYNLSAQSHLSDIMGVDRSWVSNVVNPNVKPKSISSDKADLIIAHLDNSLSKVWLMKGIGSMYIDGRGVPGEDDNDIPSHVAHASNDQQDELIAMINRLLAEQRDEFNEKFNQLAHSIGRKYDADGDGSVSYVAESSKYEK